VLKALAGAGNAPPATQVSNSAQVSLNRPGGAA
jgi:hypothetical protein